MHAFLTSKMASAAPIPSPNLKRLSFAKVAASGSLKKGPPVDTAARGISKSCQDSPTTKEISAAQPTSTKQQSPIPDEVIYLEIETHPTQGTSSKQASTEDLQELKPNASLSLTTTSIEVEGDAAMALLGSSQEPGLLLNGNAPAYGSIRSGSIGKANSNRTSSSDEVSQKADSGSEVGTKPPSLDGKSITSGTTFNALDEKESLRPDDSASVKAAAEDDDAFSVRGSLMANFRIGSDVAARAHSIQLGDMPLRSVPRINLEQTVSGALTPQSSSSEQQPITEARVQLATTASPADALNGQNPDDKLLDAMQSPKDRLFLLRLEHDVVNFVENSKEPFMDLPPSNSFCRMLTHKLADYYHMTHSFEAVAGSVRIFRTPFCRVPPPLASLVDTPSSDSSSPPLVVQPKKIMRRGEDVEIPASSSPSKPTSEVGSDKDKTNNPKEPLSREAREEAYNKARERIFGNPIPVESSTPENEDDTGVSRASSVSAKEKGNLSRKGKMGKLRRDDSESFDSRSQYAPYYAHPQQPTWMPQQYTPASNALFIAAAQVQVHQPQYMPLAPNQLRQQHPMPPSSLSKDQQLQAPLFEKAIQPHIMYDNSATSSSPMPGNNGIPPHAVNLVQPYPSSAVSSVQPVQATAPVCTYVSTAQPNITMQQQQWQQPTSFTLGSFPPAPAKSAPSHVNIPYAYGQLPANVNPNDPKSLHPIPGSYSGNYIRSTFNPQIQSFIPGGGIMRGSPPAPQTSYSGGPQAAAISHSLSPRTFNNTTYQQTGVLQKSYAGTGNASYGMMQQSPNIMAASFTPPPMPQALSNYHLMPPCNGGQCSSRNTASCGPLMNGVPNASSLGPACRHAQGLGYGPGHSPSRGPVHQMGLLPHRVSQNHKQKSQNTPCFGSENIVGQQRHIGGSQTFSHLPNYGNPATLPQKPPAT